MIDMIRRGFPEKGWYTYVPMPNGGHAKRGPYSTKQLALAPYMTPEAKWMHPGVFAKYHWIRPFGSFGIIF
jgi:hypothetical protein